jgi:uncharacterized RDD family membrane protein YckC
MTMEPREGSSSPTPDSNEAAPANAMSPTPPPAETDPASLRPPAAVPPPTGATTPPPAYAPPPAAPPPSVAWERPEAIAGPAPGIEFAPHGARLVAYIVDGIIIGIVVSAIAIIGSIVIFAGATYEGNRLTSVSPASALIGSIILFVSVLVGILYFPYFWSHGGSTLGMRPFNLRVVRDSDGGAIGWGTAFLRLIGLWVAGLVFYLGYIWIFIDKRRRGWQDLIAGTVMIKR